MLVRKDRDWIVGCITLLVKDLARSRQFYVDRLGLPVEREKPDDYIMVKAGALRICIDRVGKPKARGGGATLFSLVKNVRSAARELERRGISYEFHKDQHGEYLSANDPEGYELIFTKTV